ncbi:hypothetical protein ABZW03_20885, partial [Kitasatospora sp. NPDC004799]|uniref:hypothetical protein n=1 Tax=Kitasatospora sp. NPDC004799 TaxID=3154460 RepID=UPI0033AB7648
MTVYRRLRAALSGTAVELTPEEALDAFWLATHLPAGAAAPIVRTLAGPEPDDRAATAAAGAGPVRPHPPVKPAADHPGLHATEPP